MLTQFESELKEKIEGFAVTKVPKDSYLLIEGELCPGVPLIIEGSVKIIKEEEDSGREIVLYRVNPGEGCIMSITSSMLNIPTEMSAITETAVSLYMIPTNVSREWIKVFDSWSDFILKTTNQRYFEVVRLVHNLSFKSTGERLLEWLRQNQDANGVIYTKHDELARELGTAREVVSRLLKSYERQQLLNLTRGKVELTNSAG